MKPTVEQLKKDFEYNQLRTWLQTEIEAYM